MPRSTRTVVLVTPGRETTNSIRNSQLATSVPFGPPRADRVELAACDSPDRPDYLDATPLVLSVTLLLKSAML
jgi:hypothetical protein